MIDNTLLLKGLISKGQIRLHEAEVLHQPPTQLPTSFNFERIEGMLLGLAIGDALGATTEGQKSSERRKRYGEIRDYVPGKLSDNRAVEVATCFGDFFFVVRLLKHPKSLQLGRLGLSNALFKRPNGNIKGEK